MPREYHDDELKILEVEIQGIAVNVYLKWDEIKVARKNREKFKEDIKNEDTVYDDSEGDS
ncbi:MAG: hypothetical protein ACOX5F_06140 [Anaerovoracaceae bacterium]